MNNFINLDTHRPLRNGFSETIFCAGKAPSQVLTIVKQFVANGQNVLGTRVTSEMGEEIKRAYPDAVYDETSRTFRILNRPIASLSGKLVILCAGTADVPVAEEAKITAGFFGVEPVTHYDVGIAGLHRLLAKLDDLKDADVAIVAAGMEGALPSVVGGLIGLPIIAVPTSVGYGTNLGGIATLLAMLNSCAEGITVVNIDNGFGAACAAIRILRTLRRASLAQG